MENNQTQKERFLKLNFFKKIWYSIAKFEKYPEMAALGVKKAILYFTELMIIFSVLYTGTYVYYVANIAEFDEPNLALSEKMVNLLVKESESENQEIVQTTEILKQYPDSTIIFTLWISVFISFYIATLMDVFTLSIFGLFTCLIARIKMNYKAVFNMSIFALTLSVILRIIYSMITMLTNFEIKYFEIMYIAVAYISLAAAIFLIKSDVIKQQLQLMKIIEESKEKIEEKITIPRKPKEEEKEENKEEKKEERKEKQEKGTEEQGSNA